MFTNPTYKTSIISFLLMVGFWGLLFNSLTLAITLLVLLAIHEYGHMALQKRYGMDASPPVFTPIGAMITLKSMPLHATQEAVMALAGPVYGTVGALAAFGLGLALDNEHILLGAKFGFYLNLFNLIPLSPMDGGRVSMAFTRHLWIIGLPMFAYVLFSNGLSLLNVILGFLIIQYAFADVRMRKQQSEIQPFYFHVPMKTRLLLGASYIGLAAFLVYMILDFQNVVAWLG